MSIVNYYDNIIERLKNILESEFKKSIKIYKQDRFDLNHNSICLHENESFQKLTLAPFITLDEYPVTIILKHKWQKDENKKKYLYKDLHRIKTSLLANRSDNEIGWINGLIEYSEPIEIEYDENENPVFWKIVSNWKCIIFIDRRTVPDHPDYIYIKATSQAEETDLHLSDGTNWNVSKALLKIIYIITSSTDWDLYLLFNDNGYAADDGTFPKIQLIEQGYETEIIQLDLPYRDDDDNKEIHLYFIDNSGSNTFDVYVWGIKLD